MNMLGELNINTIIWRKNNDDDDYCCYINNCGIGKETKLVDYISKINYGSAYDKVIATHENQVINHMNCNILLQHIEHNTILEIRAPVSDGLQILTNVSHKIRIPLTNILGILTIIDELKENKISKKNIETLKKSCYEMIEVVNDIIDIVNLGRGELRLNIEKCNLSNIMQQCYDITIKEVKSKKLSLKFIIDKHVPDIIFVDVTKLKQIMINIINNAIKHTHIGGIVVNVSLYNKTNEINSPFEHITPNFPSYNILFSIKDTGSGMDSAARSYLETLLGITKINNNNCYKYTGLGLIISKAICNLMHGNIWFRSEHNIGSVFYFNIITDGIRLDQ